MFARFWNVYKCCSIVCPTGGFLPWYFLLLLFKRLGFTSSQNSILSHGERICGLLTNPSF